MLVLLNTLVLRRWLNTSTQWGSRQASTEHERWLRFKNTFNIGGKVRHESTTEYYISFSLTQQHTQTLKDPAYAAQPQRSALPPRDRPNGEPNVINLRLHTVFFLLLIDCHRWAGTTATSDRRRDLLAGCTPFSPTQLNCYFWGNILGSFLKTNDWWSATITRKRNNTHYAFWAGHARIRMCAYYYHSTYNQFGLYLRSGDEVIVHARVR